MECYTCEQPAARQCARCSRPYCPDHGDDPESGGQGLCAGCLSPLNATPSSAVFRTSLFALLIGSVLALWLLVRPPSVPGEGDQSAVPQPTSGPTPSTTSPPGGTPLPTGAGTPGPTAEPGVTGTPAAAATPTPAGPQQYTVQEGDTWYGIAETFGVDAEALAAANGLTLDDVLQVGQVLVIPQ